MYPQTVVDTPSNLTKDRLYRVTRLVLSLCCDQQQSTDNYSPLWGTHQISRMQVLQFQQKLFIGRKNSRYGIDSVPEIGSDSVPEI